MIPECPRCGDHCYRDSTAEVVYDFFPGSPEIRQLFRLASLGIDHVLKCQACEWFTPMGLAIVQPIMKRDRLARAGKGPRGRRR